MLEVSVTPFAAAIQEAGAFKLMMNFLIYGALILRGILRGH